MEYRRLGHTDIDVSAICLGTMTWGQQNTEAEGHEQMDYAVEMGINFFDTAEMYAVPPKAETQGKTKKLSAHGFKKTIIAKILFSPTKVAGRAPMDWLRDDGSGTEQTPAQIHEAVDKSLKRLQTDYIDLYQLHWPDRPIRIFGGLGHKEMGGEINKIEDILGALADIQKAGKVRHFGLSMRHPQGYEISAPCGNG